MNRIWLLVLVLVALGNSGCTHTALARRTVNQASTLTDLQYRQVLDNAAMFACNPDALPWHLKLVGGSVQVTDQGTGLFNEVITKGKPNVYSLTVTGQRGVVNQWGVIPTVDADNLQLLELAYRKAVDPLDAEGCLREKLYAKILELAVQFNIVLSEETLVRAIDSVGRLDEAKKTLLKRRAADLHWRLEETFDVVARLSRPITEGEIDDYAKRLFSKITEETRGEAKAKAQQQQDRDRVNVMQARISVEDEIVRLTREATDLPFVPRYPVTGRAEHNLRSTELAEKQITVLLDLAENPDFGRPWLVMASSRLHLPHCVCYVGEYCKCGCHRFVGVAPADLGTLRRFTLGVLTLAPITSQESSATVPGGSISYSPTIAR